MPSINIWAPVFLRCTFLRVNLLQPYSSSSSLHASLNMPSRNPGPAHFSFHPRWRRESPDSEGSPNWIPRECHVCTRAGVPVFHSTTCPDNAHSPQWEASAGSSLFPIKSQETDRRRQAAFGVLDPRSKRVQRWNRTFLLARGVALAVDPLFFYTLSIGRAGSPCLHMNLALAAAVTCARTCVDAIHLFHLWLQFRLAYVSRKSLVIGCGKLVWDPRAVATHYLRSMKGFWFDVFVILPIPQAVFLLAMPRLLEEDRIRTNMIVTILLVSFMFQFLPKVYHSLYLMRRMQKVTGYLFGTIWWGFVLNLLAYFIASHVAGGCWYILAIRRVESCLEQQGTLGSNLCAATSTSVKSSCWDVNGPFRYGIYEWALPVVSSTSVAVKILYPIFWGLITLSTFGNCLEPTSQVLEVVFSICAVFGGLMLFTLLIGNIQVFLHAVMAKKKKMQLRCRDMEWWMKRRQLPIQLRQRVRCYERQRWAVVGSDDGTQLLKDFPQGLRRDIKRFLCLDLIQKVPLFHGMDDLILDNICDRVKPLVYSKNEKIIHEGDPVQRILFMVRGRVQSSQRLSRGTTATSLLKPGGFFGDELLSWCLRRPFVDRLPPSSATFTCIQSVEAFALEANDLRYITDHFRYKFANMRMTRTARYYSSNWRTWGAVNIQLAWRRYVHRTKDVWHCCGSDNGDDDDRRVRRYASVFLAIRPRDQLQ